MLSAVTLCGCQSLSPHNPSSPLGGLTGAKKEQETLAKHTEIQAEVRRFADIYAVMVAQAQDELAKEVTTPQARAEVLDRKVNQISSAFIIATGPSPIVNLLDMVVFVTLTRMSQEYYWVPKVYGDKGMPLLMILKSRETEVWKLAARHLDPDQLRNLRELIEAWHKKYPELHYTAFLHFAEFAALLGIDVEQEGKKKGSVFGLLHLDPLAGLKPATRQLEQSRNLAERAMYYGQRLPILLQWRAQVVFLYMLATPEVQQTLSMSERWTKEMELIPSLVAREREAAIRNFFQSLANERTNVINSLMAQQAPATGLLTNLQSTLATGRETAQAATELVKSSDKLFQRYEKSQERPGAANKRPFDIRDYVEFMSETANTATQLNTMVISGSQTLPKVEETGKQLADHIFRLALIFLVAIAVVAFVYRWVVWTLFKPGPRKLD